MFNNAYQDKTVLVTGHTGFKGSWLCEWLLSLGAKVLGYALDPQAHELLFDQLGLSSRIHTNHRADILDQEKLNQVVKDTKADIIFHLAAQPLVQLSYQQPVQTFATNVMGTAHLLEAVRLSGHPCSVVAVTTDKCYENKEWLHGYREEDPMGGHDPYSASKAAAELIITSYRQSFFRKQSNSTAHQVRLASARAGNVIGGGDWAKDRIVPDCIRALKKGEAIPVRNKTSTRPWQHVLEPLSAYLWLGASLSQADEKSRPPLSSLQSAFNFGPDLESNKTVADLVEQILKIIPGDWADHSAPNAPHEAGKLNLATDKAFHLLQWQPVWDFEKTVQMTIDWYQQAANVEAAQTQLHMQKFTQAQIETYTNHASRKAVKWSL